MLAGSIGMESELDKGSTFWLDIPVTITKENPETVENEKLANKKDD
jgi:hypothetical protein